MRAIIIVFITILFLPLISSSQIPDNASLNVISSLENGQGVISVSINDESISCQLAASYFDLGTPFNQNENDIDQSIFQSIYDSYISNGINTLGSIGIDNFSEAPTLSVILESDDGILASFVTGGELPAEVSDFIGFINLHLEDPWKISFNEVTPILLPEEPICAQTANLRALKSNSSHYHSATSIGYKITMQDAARLGMIQTTSKGCHTGDCIKITFNADQSFNQDEVSALVFANVAGTATQNDIDNFKTVVESKWSNLRATNGKTLNAEVICRINSSNTGVPGQHDVNFNDIVQGRNEVVADLTSLVNTSQKAIVNITTGVGSGSYDVNDFWVHEFGHLLGLPDRYIIASHNCLNDDFFVQNPPIRRFQRISESEMAQKLNSFGSVNIPPFTFAASDYLFDFETSCPFSPVDSPQTLYCSRDIMADPRKSIAQQDIDQLVDIGSDYIILEINVGDPLIPSVPAFQNFFVTRSDFILLKKGDSITLDGIWGAEFHQNSLTSDPPEGEVLNVAPNIFDWEINTPSVNRVREILEEVNAGELFCDDFDHQEEIWRLAELSDFPDLVGNSSSSGTSFIVPTVLATNTIDSIPTLSEWGIIILGLFFLTFSVIMIKPRRSVT